MPSSASPRNQVTLPWAMSARNRAVSSDRSARSAMRSAAWLASSYNPASRAALTAWSSSSTASSGSACRGQVSRFGQFTLGDRHLSGEQVEAAPDGEHPAPG